MQIPFARLSGGGLLYVVGNARLPEVSEEVLPEVLPDIPLDALPDAEAPAEDYVAFSAAEAGIPQAASFSSGTSFYVPWDKSYLDQFSNYIIGGLGAVGVVCALVFILPFGLNLFFGFVHSLKK